MPVSSHNLVEGTSVVLRDNIHPHVLKEILRLEADEVYHVQSVQIFPLKTLLPREYIEAGYIPDHYAPHMIKGVATTNHDTMGSDRFVNVGGQQFSGAWFRPATAQEVNRHAKSML